MGQKRDDNIFYIYVLAIVSVVAISAFVITYMFRAPTSGLPISGEEQAGQALKTIPSTNYPIIQGCVDSDEGKKSYIKGTTTFQDESFEDTCESLFGGQSSDTVREYFCENGEANVELMDCPGGCEEGACQPFCTDSDGGQDEFTKGETENRMNLEKDTCNDLNSVSEYYCEGETLRVMTKDCPQGYKCQDGACVDGCFDVTEHNDPFVKGETLSGENSLADYCNLDSNVVEIYCDDVTHEFSTRKVNCEHGCYDGACKICRETDDNDPYVKGETSFADTTMEDSCRSENNLAETYCEDEGTVTPRYIDCPGGCRDGACVRCTDTDGGGRDQIFKSGTASNALETAKDRCDGKYLIEAYCSGEEVKTEKTLCGNGCEKGACLQK